MTLKLFNPTMSQGSIQCTQLDTSPIGDVRREHAEATLRARVLRMVMYAKQHEAGERIDPVDCSRRIASLSEAEAELLIEIAMEELKYTYRRGAGRRGGSHAGDVCERLPKTRRKKG